MRKIVVNNTKPRLDTEGEIVDCHESHIEQFDGRFYLYGMGYGNRTGWTNENLMTCYSTEDFREWTNHGPLSEPVRVCIPHVKYNAASGKYVMWYSSDREYYTKISDSPTGPFVEPKPARTSGPGAGDFSLFVDPDGTAYVIYTSCFADRNYPLGMHLIVIEQLTDDYRNGTGKVCGPMGWNCESPVMFRRGDLYYVLFDNTCCWNPNGTGCRVYTADKALGPYEYRGDINRNVDSDPRKIMSKSTDTKPGDGRTDVIIPIQTRDVAEVQTTNGVEYFLSGDRWGSNEDGWKGHDYVYCTSPLKFGKDGMIQQLKMEEEWSLEL